MAGQNIAQTLAEKPDPTASDGVIVGKYSYRFDGVVMLYNIRYKVVGLGLMDITADGAISGRHRSSITALEGQKAHIETGAYDLTGTISVDSVGTGTSAIKFKKFAGCGVDVDGDFFVQVAGSPDRLWFISSKTTLPGSHGAKADELVTLEAVRMTSV